ncbi:MAG: DUF3368 domain-containing protein [Chloroflexota bacterium]|nr:DUF3368 domain-containing protein [Chloroflexota bacterium]
MIGKQLVILDNTLFSNFSLVGQANLIIQAWPEAATTTFVINEYQRGIEVRKIPDILWDEIRILKLHNVERNLMDSMSSSLGAGESSCLAIAYHRNGLLVSDDLKARQIARSMEVSVSGTLGTLLRCVEGRIISLDAANSLLGKMIDYGYHSPIERLTDLIK